MDKNLVLIALSESAQTGFGKVEFEEQSIPREKRMTAQNPELRARIGVRRNREERTMSA